MKHLRGLFIVLYVLVGCSPELTTSQHQATAGVRGCWEYGVPQPILGSTPNVSETPTLEPIDWRTPTASPTPYNGPWPECTPLPATPTRTPTPVPTRTLIPPETPAIPVNPPSFDIQELGDFAGVATNQTAAFAPKASDFIAAWIAWGYGTEEATGDVWYRIYHRGEWYPAKTINRDPVRKGQGGVAVGFRPTDNAAVIAWGDSSRNIWISVSKDVGKTWDDYAMPHVGTVQKMIIDDSGLIHLMWIAVGGDDRWLEYSQGQDTTWSTPYRFVGNSNGWGDLEVVQDGAGVVRWAVVADAGDAVRLYRSTDGLSWTESVLPTHAYMYEEARQDVDLLVVPRNGSWLVAAAWGQYSEPGLFATYSLDGGQSWSTEERIAQRRPALDANGEESTGYRAGYKPSLIYDRTTDALGSIWNRLDAQQGWQVMFSYRLLNPEEAGVGMWRAAAPPDPEQDTSLPVTSHGWQARAVAAPVGDPMLLSMEIRNRQYRVVVQPFHPTPLIKKGTS